MCIQTQLQQANAQLSGLHLNLNVEKMGRRNRLTLAGEYGNAIQISNLLAKDLPVCIQEILKLFL